MQVTPGGIDISRIQSMLEQLRAAGARTQAPASPLNATATQAPAQKLDFGTALKASLDNVAQSQKTAEVMSQRFSMGDESVNLSDVMIAQQKAGIAFQATIQVRNKLVSAYHDIMTMQV